MLPTTQIPAAAPLEDNVFTNPLRSQLVASKLKQGSSPGRVKQSSVTRLPSYRVNLNERQAMKVQGGE